MGGPGSGRKPTGRTKNPITGHTNTKNIGGGMALRRAQIKSKSSIAKRNATSKSMHSIMSNRGYRPGKK